MPRMASLGVTCHPAELIFPPLPRPKLVLDLATPEGCKTELTYMVYVICAGGGDMAATFVDTG